MNRDEAVRRLTEAHEARVHTREQLDRARDAREVAIADALDAGLPMTEVMDITGLNQPNASRARRRGRAKR